jgi:hypothetical protein
VANVSIASVMKGSVENSVITVYCSESPAEVVSLVAAAVRQSAVLVLKLNYDDEPEVDDQVGHTINCHKTRIMHKNPKLFQTQARSSNRPFSEKRTKMDWETSSYAERNAEFYEIDHEKNSAKLLQQRRCFPPTGDAFILRVKK